VGDPLLRALHPEPEPTEEKLVKHRLDPDLAASGTPRAGRTTVEEARRKGILGWLQLLGPGLITGASDDDPSGIGTYSQVGSQFGFGLLWTALFTFPMMAAVQELCARIALQTGVGLGVSLRRKFPSALVGVAILGRLIANTIKIGADLGAVAAGGSLLSGNRIPGIWLVVPVALAILVLQWYATYAVIFDIFKWLTVALFAYVVTAFFVHPQLLDVVRATVLPHFEVSRDFVTALVAVLGTTISPYLFFWQASSEIDELRAAGKPIEEQRHGVRAKEMRAARVDIMIGMFFSQLVMYFIILTSGAVLHAHGKTGVQTATQAAAALQPLAGPFAFVVFAVGMIGSGLLAIPILSGSATYALKEFLGFKGSLIARARYRPTFYLILTAATVAGVLMNFVHLDPIRALFWTAVVNGVVAPPLLALIVLLGADRKLMGKRVSGRLSLVLGWITTAFMALAAMVMIATMVRG
jgi:NRAMP (natural resistance-associated macrophage protein)-like metal ion transporter